jgi:glycogen operon protein
MLLAGDEFARAQEGNNNAYCQDNEISWIDWQGIDADRAALAKFVQRLLMIRDALPMLRRGRFLAGEFDEELGVKDVAWINPSGDEMTAAQWQEQNARCLGVLLDGRAQETGVRRVGNDATLLLIVNSYGGVVPFKLPEAVGGKQWVCLVDTNQPDLDELPRFDFGHSYEVTGRSLLLFILEPDRTRRRPTAAERSFEHVIDVISAGAELALPAR